MPVCQPHMHSTEQAPPHLKSYSFGSTGLSFSCAAHLEARHICFDDGSPMTEATKVPCMHPYLFLSEAIWLSGQSGLAYAISIDIHKTLENISVHYILYTIGSLHIVSVADIGGQEFCTHFVHCILLVFVFCNYICVDLCKHAETLSAVEDANATAIEEAT